MWKNERNGDWNDLRRTLAVFDELFHQWGNGNGWGKPNRVFPGLGTRPGYATTWPATNIYDTGKDLVLEATVPGLGEKDIEISATADSLSITGKRTTTAPDGYSTHRKERSDVEFARTYALPCKVDVERAKAHVRDGLITITMAKAEESQPRQIAVKTQK